MEVSVIGKALVPHDYMPNASCEIGADLRMKHLYLPLSSRQYLDTKLPMQLSLEAKSKNEKHWSPNDQKYDRARLNLTPSFRNMTLSETYSFARAQLKACPTQQYQKRNMRTPTFAFTKAKLINLANEERDDQKKIDSLSDPVTPLVSCRSGSGNTTPGPSPETSCHKKSSAIRYLSRCHAKSVCDYRRPRHRSSRKKKSLPGTASSNNASRIADNELNILMRVPTDLPIRCNLPPPKTQQSSVILLRNICDKPSKDDDEILSSFHTKPIVKGCSSGNFGNRLQPPSASRVPKRTDYRFGISDPLLTSLDSSLNRKVKHEKQLSMRIQLIHKYGDEDVIGKHMEMRRRREAANRHEKKNLENQANAKLKEIQRSKIYALNTLMTKLEQEQFEEYKQSL